MSEPVGRIDSIVIDVLDIGAPEALLGRAARHHRGERDAACVPVFLWFAPQLPGGITVALQAVETASDGPRRLHLDLGVTDREAAKAKVLELGGSHVADHEIPGFGWSVMADPEGNEFCVAVHD